MSTAATSTRDELQIKALIERFAQAIHDKDVDRVMTVYSDDLRGFDVIPPLQIRGADRYRKNFEDWFGSWEGPIGLEVTDLNISASGDVAFASSLNHVTGTPKEGEETDIWMRITLGLRKIGGEWKATHEHVSVPFDMQTQRAAIDLRP